MTWKFGEGDGQQEGRHRPEGWYETLAFSGVSFLCVSTADDRRYRPLYLIAHATADFSRRVCNLKATRNMVVGPFVFGGRLDEMQRVLRVSLSCKERPNSRDGLVDRRWFFYPHQKACGYTLGK